MLTTSTGHLARGAQIQHLDRVGSALARNGIWTALLALLGVGALTALVVAFDAPYVLGALVVLAAVVAMLIRPDLATITVVLLLYVNFPSILVKQHGVPD